MQSTRCPGPRRFHGIIRARLPGRLRFFARAIKNYQPTLPLDRLYCLELNTRTPQTHYTHLKDDLLDEMVNRTPLYEQPHFKDILKGRAAQRDGIWNYQKRAASPNQ